MKYSEREIDIIKTFYYEQGAKGTKEILERCGFNRSIKGIQHFASSNGITCKHAGGFKVGSTPPNKGKKMSAEAYEHSKKTFFQSGENHHLIKPVGTISNHGGDWRIKLENGKWAFYHRYLYEQTHGEIPPGHRVIFKDGNKNNLSIDNIICVSESQLRSMVRIRYNEQVRQAKAKQEEHRQMLRQKYGSITAALAAGERLLASG